MAFDPTLPKTDSEMVSAEMRNQFNGLKSLIDELTLRVAALEPHGYFASGFGSAGANGALTIMGTFAGKPYYQAAGGWYYCWNPDGGMWICRDAAPGTGDMSNNRYADLQFATDITAVQWTGGFNPGDLPCGTVVLA